MTEPSLDAELNAAEAIILLDDRGVPADRIAVLRRWFRAVGARLHSVRTRKLRRVLLGTRFALLAHHCSGRLLLLTVRGDPAAVAKLVHDAEDDRLRVRASALPGELLALAEMARLPRRPYVRAIARAAAWRPDNAARTAARSLHRAVDGRPR